MIKTECEILFGIGEQIRSQDNRATSDPLFLVQEKKRIWGMDGDYCDDYEWVSEDDCEHVAGDLERAGLDAKSETGEDTSGWSRVFYVDRWEFVTACFTEQACNDYIEANAHNLNEPRIYAASLYRNDEMIAVRNMLANASELH